MSSDEKILYLENYIKKLSVVLQNLPLESLSRVLEILENAFVERQKIFLVGNGGSATTAMHMANDLLLGVAKSRDHGLQAISLSDNISILTALANDHDFSEVFAAQLTAMAENNDVLIVISGSGNSTNIIRAIEIAKQMGMTTIGFLGMGGGKAAQLVDVPVIVVSGEYGVIEDIHMIFDHMITAYLQEPIEKR